jgi:5S rRNA maturation endonuclease (ribonuclease M5)
MLENLQEISGEDYSDLIEEVYDGEVLGGVVPSWERRSVKSESIRAMPYPPDEVYLDIYDELPEGHWYLEDRGISKETAIELDLRVDPEDWGQERILFPVRSPDNVFYGYTGRITNSKINSKEHPKVRDYFGLPKAFLLIGAEKVCKEDEFVIVVEGPFDYAMCHEYGWPSVGTMHSGVTRQQLDILKRLKKPLVLMQDNDRAGNQGNSEIAEQMYMHVPVYGVYYPEHVKDPGTLTARQMATMLDDRELLTDLQTIAMFYGHEFRNGRIYRG